MLFSSLAVVHVFFTTAGYLGLIVANIWLLLLVRAQHSVVTLEAIRTWRRSAQICGPLLGIGLVLGFGLAAVAHMSPATSWLIATYALIAAALGTQAAVMIPWQLRANALAASGSSVPLRPVVFVLAVLVIVYALILTLMVLRPV
jgi:hypothetical protein